MNILLIMPHPNSKMNFLSKFQYPSLTLQQIAGITPREHKIEIIDERYEKINFGKYYDLIIEICESTLYLRICDAFIAAWAFASSWTSSGRGLPAVINAQSS